MKTLSRLLLAAAVLAASSGAFAATAKRRPPAGTTRQGAGAGLRTETFHVSGRIGFTPVIATSRVSRRILEIVDVQTTGPATTHVMGAGTNTLVLRAYFNGDLWNGPATASATVTVRYLAE